MLARLRLNTAAAGLSNVEVHQADGQALPFPDESFDLAVSMFGLMFFPDRTKGFSELCRVLRPGGQALVSSWAPASRSPLMQTVMAAFQSDDATPGEPPPSGLEDPLVFEREMQAAGLSDVSVTAATHALEVGNVEEFWRDTVRGTAPIALMKQRMEAQEWSEIERHALERLRRMLGREASGVAGVDGLSRRRPQALIEEPRAGGVTGTGRGPAFRLSASDSAPAWS